MLCRSKGDGVLTLNYCSIVSPLTCSLWLKSRYSVFTFFSVLLFHQFVFTRLQSFTFVLQSYSVVLRCGFVVAVNRFAVVLIHFAIVCLVSKSCSVVSTRLCSRILSFVVVLTRFVFVFTRVPQSSKLVLHSRLIVCSCLLVFHSCWLVLQLPNRLTFVYSLVLQSWLLVQFFVLSLSSRLSRFTFVITRVWFYYVNLYMQWSIWMLIFTLI